MCRSFDVKSVNIVKPINILPLGLKAAPTRQASSPLINVSAVLGEQLEAQILADQQSLHVSVPSSADYSDDLEERTGKLLFRLLRRQNRDAVNRKNRVRSISLRPGYTNKLTPSQIAVAIQRSHDIRQEFLRKEQQQRTLSALLKQKGCIP